MKLSKSLVPLEIGNCVNRLHSIPRGAFFDRLFPTFVTFIAKNLAETASTLQRELLNTASALKARMKTQEKNIF